MPIIHKLHHEIVKPPLELIGFPKAAHLQRLNKYNKSKSLARYMFYCTCLHPENNHHEFNNFICTYSGMYCECQGLLPLNLKLIITISEIDIFEMETENLPEKDSFEYWNEFNLWRIRNENN